MEKAEYVHNVFESIAAGYDAANARISLGRHMKWKKAAVCGLLSAVPECGVVLDLCCGTGDITELLLSVRPDIRVIGLDFSEAMLKIAERRFENDKRVSLVEGDAMHLPFADGDFDAVIISFALRNTADYARVIGEMARVLKSGGRLCCIDSFMPESKIVKFFYTIYFSHVMPLLGGGIKNREEYRWLCESTREFIGPGELRKIMSGAGLSVFEPDSFMLGACVSISGDKQEGHSENRE